MASIQSVSRKKGKAWRVVIRRKGYPQLIKTFPNKTFAVQWAEDIESDMRKGKYFSPNSQKIHTVNEMIDRYCERNFKHEDGQYKTKITHLRWWKQELGSYALNQLSPSILVECKEKLLAERIQKKPRSVSTVNRYLATFSMVLNIACREWEWLDNSPMRKVKKYKEPRGRVRFLNDEERELLLEACKESTDSQLYPIVLLAISTGMRQGEMLNLMWTDVDLEEGKAVLHDTKNGERRSVAIKGPGLKALRLHKEKQQAKTLFVFPNEKSTGPTCIRNSWEKALKYSGVQDFRFHDLRHTFASYTAMSGASLAELAAALGHKTLVMVQRYAHLSEAHTAGVVGKMCDIWLSKDGKYLEAQTAL